MKHGIAIRVALLAAALAAGGCAATAVRHDLPPPARPPAPAPAPATGAIYQPGHALALFEDLKARRVGDILTVVLTEQTDATKKASTATERETAIDLAGPTVLGRKVTRGGSELLATKVDGTHAFSGEGETSQSNSLSGSIAVTVVAVLPSGNLLVRGEKRLRINHEDEHIRLEGIVRPADIGPDNTVPSTKVAEARISYVGKGQVADANRMGWLARFFLSVVWPF